jgi:REP element-mobilizing transposase RayT
MPSPTLKRFFRPKSYYHIYNRGAYQNNIFREAGDYWVFRRIFRGLIKEGCGAVQEKTFSLLPNHYHFHFYQREERDISKLMHRAAVKYGLFLREKYDHSGRFCQGPYQSVYLPTKTDQMRVHRYILENPQQAGLPASWTHVGTKF